MCEAPDAKHPSSGMCIQGKDPLFVRDRRRMRDTARTAAHESETQRPCTSGAVERRRLGESCNMMISDALIPNTTLRGRDPPHNTAALIEFTQ